MTVTTEVARATFPWTGVETSFSCGFPADDVSHLRVFFRTNAGVTTTMTLGVNYNATLASGTKLATVTPISLPAASGTVIVRRLTPAQVAEVLADGQEYSLAVIQQLHDRAAMRSAEDRSTLSRAVVLAEGDEIGAGGFDLQNTRLSNLAPGINSNDAATVAQAQAVAAAEGNVPQPVSGDANRLLVATGAGSFAWLQMALAMMPDGFLSADAAGRAKMAAGFLLASHVSTDPAELAALRTLLGVPLLGQCRLTLSGGNLLLSPCEGDLLAINGVNETVPVSGVSLAPTGLTIDTVHYVYAYMNSGTMTLEASTTPPTTDVATGMQIKSGDDSRTLVGMAYPTTGPAFLDTATARHVASYFNRKLRPLVATLATAAVVTDTSFATISALRVSFLTWGDEPLNVGSAGSWAVAGVATGFASFQFDGSVAGVARAATASNVAGPLALIEIASTLAVGRHTVELMAYRLGGTNVQIFGTSTGADYKTTLQTAVRL